MDLLEERILSVDNQDIPVAIYKKRKKSSSASFKKGTLNIYLSHRVPKRSYNEIVDHFLRWGRKHAPSIQEGPAIVQRISSSPILLWDETELYIYYKWTTRKRRFLQLSNDTIHVYEPMTQRLTDPANPLIPATNRYTGDDQWNVLKDLCNTLTAKHEPTLQEAVRRIHETYFSKYKLGNIQLQFLKSRWGSCDAKGNIVLNSQLLLLPKQYLLYVIIHELAHLKYPHHQASFWHLVEQYCPNWKQLRNELNQWS